MTLNPLTAISPIDGRYHAATAELSAWFSESALIKHRVFIEAEYFIALCKLPLPQLASFAPEHFDGLQRLYLEFTEADAERIKTLEKTTNHDVKAVEYFIKEKFEQAGHGAFKEFVHFGLTSQDINNTAIPYLFKQAVQNSYLPLLQNLITVLDDLAAQWRDVPMLAHTHGQPASPTRLGKEIAVFTERIHTQLYQLQQIPYSAKFGGATGNFNAHHVAYPEINWAKFADDFVQNRLALTRSKTTTQIEHYDNFAAHCDALKRINTILIDLCRDVWSYISINYFGQKINPGEIGSSAMPHKVNPIDFENAEGNLGLANAIFEYLAAKLPVSRLQRDLTDSTVLRNIGVPVAHTFIAIKSVIKGLGKLVLNKETISLALNANWAVVAEALQTILRREGYPNPYEALKELTRGNREVNQERIAAFIDGLNIPETVKNEMKQISPATYTGITPS